ncbi:hypothetical protein [Vibrio splendidus]|uniref:hypothetical protein n=1 Tax=Vibrio splendidus TaxID=29497 RepID=UPI001FB55FDF|nr:hypothetical protein [Vibrio splendidus]UOE91264.1 hypothetical protein LTQ02_16430 [Vibrio splendidus]
MNEDKVWFKYGDIKNYKAMIVVVIVCVIFGLSAKDYGGALFNTAWFDITPYVFGVISIFAIIVSKSNCDRCFDLAKFVSEFLFVSLIGSIFGAIILLIFAIFFEPFSLKSLLFYVSLVLQGGVYFLLMVCLNFCVDYLIRNGVNKRSLLLLVVASITFLYVFVFNKQDTEHCVTKYRDIKEVCNLEARYELAFEIAKKLTPDI